MLVLWLVGIASSTHHDPVCSFSGLVPRPSVHALYQEPPLYYLDKGSLTLAPIIYAVSMLGLGSRPLEKLGRLGTRLLAATSGLHVVGVVCLESL